MDFPVRMHCAEPIPKAIFNVFDPVTGCEGVADESYAPLSRRDGRRILDVIAATGAIGAPMPGYPALTNLCKTQGVGRINEEAKPDLTAQEKQREQKEQYQSVPNCHTAPNGRTTPQFCLS